MVNKNSGILVSSDHMPFTTTVDTLTWMEYFRRERVKEAVALF